MSMRGLLDLCLEDTDEDNNLHTTNMTEENGYSTSVYNEANKISKPGDVDLKSPDQDV